MKTLFPILGLILVGIAALIFLACAAALPLSAQEKKGWMSYGTADGGTVEVCPDKDGLVSAAACPGFKPQTSLTPEEHDAYVLMVIQDLVSQNVLLENLRTHKAGNDDLENRERAHAERAKAIQELIKKHNACQGGDWNIAKKEWACPAKP
jgi:hypothetical protein